MRVTSPIPVPFFFLLCGTRLAASRPVPLRRDWQPRADDDGPGITDKMAGYGQHVCSTCSPATQAAIVVAAVLGFLLLLYLIYRWRSRKNKADRDAAQQQADQAREEETVEAAHVKRRDEAQARAAKAVDMVSEFLKAGEGPSSHKP